SIITMSSCTTVSPAALLPCEGAREIERRGVLWRKLRVCGQASACYPYPTSEGAHHERDCGSVRKQRSIPRTGCNPWRPTKARRCSRNRRWVCGIVHGNPAALDGLVFCGAGASGGDWRNLAG